MCCILAPRWFLNSLRNVDRSTHTDPITVYDVQAHETAKVRIFIDTDRSDNPMQSEIACHIGSNGNYPCRRCEIGGSQKEKESDVGYESFFLVRTYVCWPGL